MARTIVSIVLVEAWTKDGKEHYRTHALLDNQEEAQGYGKYEVGESVEAWFSDEWDKYTMAKPKPKTGE